MKKKSVGITMAVFLLGIFMGAIDSGIVSPARDIIAEYFGMNANKVTEDMNAKPTIEIQN